MVLCEECGGNDFDIHDGLYFCTSCHTQSQNWVEEGVSDDYAFSFTSGGSSGSSSISRRRINRRGFTKSAASDLGDEWISYEAFDLILKKQVDALMFLGASRKFKVIVCELWLRYLRMLGLLCDKNSNFVPKVQVCPRKRDYDIMLQNRRVVSSNVFYDSQKRYQERRLRMSGFVTLKRKKSGATDAENDDEEQSSQLTEFGYLSDASDGTDQLTEASQDVPDSFPCSLISRRHYKMRKSKSWQYDISHMKLSHTVAFLYLAVLLSDEQILMGDLLRWIYEGHLPLYNAAATVLPNSFKFQTCDSHIFRLNKHLSRRFLLNRCTLLAKYVGIRELPPKRIEVVAARFILELDLPVSLIVIVSRLVHSEPKLKRDTFLVEHEFCALAYIVVALKLVFGFNGTSEILLSEMARRLNEQDGGGYYFVLQDWFQKLQALNEARKQHVVHSLWARRLPSKLDAKKLGAFLVDKATAWRGRYISKRERRYVTKVKSVIEVLSRPFKTLQGATADADLPPSSKPSACFMPSNRIAFDNVYGESAVNASTDKWIARDFSSASIDFIIDQTDETFEAARRELLLSLPDGVDGRAWLTPWARYSFETEKPCDTSGSYYLSLIFESLCIIFKADPYNLREYIKVIEHKAFGSKPRESRARKRRKYIMKKDIPPPIWRTRKYKPRKTKIAGKLKQKATRVWL